jgi:sodium/potassium/calcium exchanger 6
MIGRTVWETLFPTLKDWKIKSLLGKIIAIVSSPAVFLLTLTLPVVDETAEDAENQEELGPGDALEEEEEEECRLGLALGAENRRVLDGLEDTANEGQGAKDGADRGRPCRPDSPQKPATRRSSLSSSDQEQPERREGHPVSYPMVDVGPGSCSASSSLDPRPALAVLSTSPGIPTHPSVDPGLLDRSSSPDAAFSDHHVARLLATVQSLLSPIFWKICLQNNEDQGPNPDHHSTSLPTDFGGGGDQGRDDVVVISDRFSLTYDNLITLGTIVGGLVLSKLVYVQLRPTEDGNNGKMKIGLCVLGFVNSMLWILSIVDQVIFVLAQLAHILHIDNAVLGLTIFGVGNSLGDLVANLTRLSSLSFSPFFL